MAVCMGLAAECGHQILDKTFFTEPRSIRDTKRAAMRKRDACLTATKEIGVNNIIYIVGLVVVVIAVLSFFGLR